VAPARAARHQDERLLVEAHALAELPGVHEPLDEGAVEGHVEPVACHARHRPLEILADASRHEDAFLDVDHLALGRLGDALGEGDAPGDGRDAAGVLARARALAEHAGQHAVGDEVGVASDRRGEVQVVPEAEREVPPALRPVARLAHAAQHRLVQQRLLGAPGGARERRGETARRERPLATGLDETQPGEEPTQGLRVLVRGGLVVAVDRRRARPEEELRHGAVRRQHRLLDRAVRGRARRLDHVDRHAVGGEHDLGRRQVEVEGAHREAAAREGVRHAPEGVELAGDLGPERLAGAALALHGERRLLVDEARAAADHRRVEGAVADVAGAVDVELGDEDQPVGGGEERAHERGEARREHRDRAVREVDRVAAPERLAVDRRAGAHVV